MEGYLPVIQTLRSVTARRGGLPCALQTERVADRGTDAGRTRWGRTHAHVHPDIGCDPSFLLISQILSVLLIDGLTLLFCYVYLIFGYETGKKAYLFLVRSPTTPQTYRQTDTDTASMQTAIAVATCVA